MSASVIHPSVQKMIDQPGVYVLGDTTHPDALIVVWSAKGRLYAMSRDQELDPARFFDTITVHAGPIGPGK